MLHCAGIKPFERTGIIRSAWCPLQRLVVLPLENHRQVITSEIVIHAAMSDNAAQRAIGTATLALWATDQHAKGMRK